MLNDLLAHWNYWWDQLLNNYHVNPLVFVVIYVCKSPFFWLGVVLTVRRARRRMWESLPGPVLLSIAANISPWVYVWIFGDNLPRWYPYVVYCLVAWGLIYLVWQVRRKLHELPGPEPVLTRRAHLPEAGQSGASAPVP